MTGHPLPSPDTYKYEVLFLYYYYEVVCPKEKETGSDTSRLLAPCSVPLQIKSITKRPGLDDDPGSPSARTVDAIDAMDDIDLGGWPVRKTHFVDGGLKLTIGNEETDVLRTCIHLHMEMEAG